MSVPYLVGCPAWERAWSLPLWFQSVRANVNPADTGLVFVVPASDTATRDVIRQNSHGFRFVEVLRDRGFERRNLATTRNQILQQAAKIRPERFIHWESDFLVPEGTVEAVRRQQLPMATVWAWLNRLPPRALTWVQDGVSHDVLLEEPARCTAMRWDPRLPGRALHYAGAEYAGRAVGTWSTGVALAWTMMGATAYANAHYAPHPDGVDIPFNWQLERRGVPRYCCGDIRGLHLYDQSQPEVSLGWPGVMALADQMPLAATNQTSRPVEWEAFGIYPKEVAA